LKRIIALGKLFVEVANTLFQLDGRSYLSAKRPASYDTATALGEQGAIVGLHGADLSIT